MSDNKWQEPEFDESEEGSFIGVCETCGQEKRVIAAIDPFFNEDITDDGENYLWCRPCLQTRAYEV